VKSRTSKKYPAATKAKTRQCSGPNGALSICSATKASIVSVAPVRAGAVA
jgi:hypothetical protein